MRLVVVSNRLSVSLHRDGEQWQIKPSSGGLATALAQFLRQRGGVWIGWPGITNQDAAGLEAPLADAAGRFGYDFVPVLLSDEELQGFYYGFSNEIVWPLFHDLQSRCNFVPEYWASYRSVTEKFADVVVNTVRKDDLLWVQDYHLMGLAGRLRERGLRNPIGFFLHIPFPAPDIFLKLPWRLEVLESLLGYNLIGFQTPRDRGNFLDCVRKLIPHAQIRRRPGGHMIQHAGRLARVGAFPIGIDYKTFSRNAAESDVTERVQAIRAEWPNVQIILGVDRLDYTKGIPDRLKAYRLALQRYPELQRAVTLLQVVVPSREAVPEYQDLKSEIERLVTQVNGEFTEPGWVPVHYIFRELDHPELLAYYRAADVAFVTPLKDGMNLVAKEYCACQIEGNGVLILSEFTGAAFRLSCGAVLVNPYDLEHVADALFRAVNMSPAERAPAMHRLRRNIARQDVYWWADEFLSACLSAAQAAGADSTGSLRDPVEEASEGLYAWTT
ncbi:MAG TPA: trehalose-6-phosphate synthase [Phycisphaerae bacterium]|jgi:trehalose 6-phosphate synthase|nr:trehalose-6-phosphate synthase [Phycisphaerae bacterium]HOB76510.1 trehalose-6-phosphate synthase [Phycisphaerae bacterium]HOJ56064.1 trehalose-6-phosphate synthase [Phycisphaerae bacterium]HOL28306.1 trehalose-6-phosphate synthase [Phycisphaerae bacterium]HPP22780.1 trehalose-6-phosphate synthase [Phycisphaerae bacterium]